MSDSTKPKKQRSKRPRNKKPKPNGDNKQKILPNKAPETKSITNRSYKTNDKGVPTSLANFGYGLSQQEKTKALAWLLNMLDPQKKFKFPRPIPALSAADLKSGQIFWESEADYVEVRVRPDPFETIMIKQLGITATVDITGIAGFGEDFRVYNSNEPNEDWLANTYRTCLQLSLPLDNGHYLDPVKKDLNGVGGGFSNNMYETDNVFMYKGITPPTANILVRCDNRASFSVQAHLDWTIRTSSGAIVSTTSGTNVTIPQGGNAVISSAAFGTLPAPTDSQYVSIDVMWVIPTGPVEIVNFGFTVTNLTGLSITAPISTQYWTLGQATYGKSSQDAVLLDEIIRGCQLWAPCGMSSKWNVDQQVNLAGGRFQTSYLPSRIDGSLPSDFGEQWTFIDSRKVSYPVAETPFVNGAQGSWVGARILDYEFRRPFASSQFQTFELDSEPQVHFLCKKVSADARITLRLDFNLAYELQTTHPAYVMDMGVYHPTLANLCVAFFAGHKLLVGENPSHTQRLKTLAKQALTNPMLQKAFKELFTLGIGLL